MRFTLLRSLMIVVYTARLQTHSVILYDVVWPCCPRGCHIDADMTDNHPGYRPWRHHMTSLTTGVMFKRGRVDESMGGRAGETDKAGRQASRQAGRQKTQCWFIAGPPSQALAIIQSTLADLSGGNDVSTEYKLTPIQCLLNVVGPASPVLASIHSVLFSTPWWRKCVHIVQNSPTSD